MVDDRHPITAGIDDFRLRDEYYYRLKFAAEGTIVPLLQASIEDRPETVAWGFLRPGSGSSLSRLRVFGTCRLGPSST